MKKNIIILIVALTCLGYSSSTYAQSSQSKTRRAKTVKPKSKSKVRARPTQSQTPMTARAKRAGKAKSPREGYFVFGPKALLWQESIVATRGADTSELRSQFSGVALGITYRKVTSNIRWVQSHALDVGAGALVAKSAGTSFTDHLKNQMWYSATLRPGMSYRTTSRSELGFGIPLTYRAIAWELKDPALMLDRETSFSYGVSGTYVTHVSKSSSLLVEVTQHIPWKAFVWSIGWNYRFQ